MKMLGIVIVHAVLVYIYVASIYKIFHTSWYKITCNYIHVQWNPSTYEDILS